MQIYYDKWKSHRGKYLKKGSFVHNVMVLVSGTALSQLITFCVSPILTRLYDPSAFGYYATYMAIVTIGGGLVAGKYDLALVLPQDENEANDLLRFASLIVISVCAVAFCLIPILGNTTAKILSMGEAYTIVWLIPLSLLLLGFITLYTNWGIRNKSFRKITLSTVLHVIATAFIQIAIALVLPAKTSGMVIGQIVGQILALIILLPNKWSSNINLRNIRLGEMMKVARRYKDFPRYMILAGLLNRMNTYIPIFVFGFFFTPTIVGFYALSQRVIKAPMSLIGGNIYTAFTKKAQELATTDFGLLRKKTYKMSLTMLLVGSVPTAILLFFSPPIFHLVFGENWVMAGRFTQAMSIYLLLQFAFTPLAVLFRILEKQNVYTLWESLRFILSLCGTVTGGVFFSPLIAVILFSISMSLAYIVLAILSWHLLAHPQKSVVEALRGD